jgi:alanine racemase
VKADAYGHGAVAVARILERVGVDFLAVAFLEEAMELRDAGIICPILNLGSTDPKNAPIVVDLDISQTVYTKELAFALSMAAVSARKEAKLHIKVDTGMHRQGVGHELAGEYATYIGTLPRVVIEGIYSHFTEADDPGSDFTHIQIGRFESAVAQVNKAGFFPALRHLANSAGILHFPEARLDMVRPGILLYGLSPDADPEAPPGFLPVMRLNAAIANIRTVAEGEGVSYGRIFRAARPSRIALLQIGYADGYSRSLSGKAHVLVRGARAPLVGRICMDQCMIDVTDIPEARMGDEATIFGAPGLPAGELARLSGTISYEVTCGISKRVPRLLEEGA